MHIFLVRHGQTQWNQEGQVRFRGRAKLPLDNIGLRQAQVTANRLSDCGAMAIYSSPLNRALMTAQLIADRLSLSVNVTCDLIDIDYGDWEGLSIEEALHENGDLYRLWLECPHEITFPGGEGLRDVRNRIVSFTSWLRLEHANHTVILVSHVVVCKVFICVVLGLDDSHFWQIGQDVCAINEIGINNTEFVLSSMNDTCHLKSE